MQEPGTRSWEGHLSRQPLKRTVAQWSSPGKHLAGPASGGATHAALAGQVQQPVTARTGQPLLHGHRTSARDVSSRRLPACPDICAYPTGMQTTSGVMIHSAQPRPHTRGCGTIAPPASAEQPDGRLSLHQLSSAPVPRSLNSARSMPADIPHRAGRGGRHRRHRQLYRGTRRTDRTGR